MRTNYRAVKARTVFAAAGLALASGLTACGAGSTSAAEVKTISAADVDPAAAAALPERYKAAGVIKVASDIPYPPMEMFDENQQLTGLDFDLAQALGAKLGVKLELQTQAFDSIIPSLQSGKNDIIMSGMNDTPERQESLDFVDYFHAGFSILVPEGNPKNITTALDLCDKDVAVQKATVQAEIVAQLRPAVQRHGIQPDPRFGTPAGDRRADCGPFREGLRRRRGLGSGGVCRQDRPG